MNSSDEQVRTAIAILAGEWFVTNEEGPLDARDAAKFAGWLTSSPVHIEEFLGVAAIARDLKAARTDPAYFLEAILARARVEDDTSVRPLWPRLIGTVRATPAHRRLTTAVAVASFAVLSLGVFLIWNLHSEQVSTPVTVQHIETRHGEQLTLRLADNSVLHLNTDSAATIRYGKTERRVELNAGQADFDVAHEASRAFRVFAGTAEVVDVGTQFDVRLERDATVVTVVEGRVAVRPSPMDPSSGASSQPPSGFVALNADQQIRVAAGEWPAAPIAVDAQNTTAWLHREIVFDHEPLERVASEYNRYASKPIEITTPALRDLEITGVFATDDADAFVAFLRSLKDVRVEVTAAQIRVSHQ